jgi:hypothetical protein
MVLARLVRKLEVTTYHSAVIAVSFEVTSLHAALVLSFSFALQEPDLTHGWRRRLKTFKLKASALKRRFHSKTSSSGSKPDTTCNANKVKEPITMSVAQRVAVGLLLFAAVVALALIRDRYEARATRKIRTSIHKTEPLLQPRRPTDSALTRRNSEENLRQEDAAGLLLLSAGAVLHHSAAVDTASVTAAVAELTHSHHTEPQPADLVRELQKSDASTNGLAELADSDAAGPLHLAGSTEPAEAASIAATAAPATAAVDWCGEILSPPTSVAAASRRALRTGSLQRDVSTEVAYTSHTALLGTEPAGLTAAQRPSLSSSGKRRSSLAGLLSSMKTRLVRPPSVQRRPSWWRRSSAHTLAETGATTTSSIASTAAAAAAATTAITAAPAAVVVTAAASAAAAPEIGNCGAEVATDDAPPSAQAVAPAPTPTTSAAAAASAAAVASARRRTALAVPTLAGAGHTACTPPQPMISPQQAASYTPPRQRDPLFDARDTLCELEQDYLAHIGVACTRRECDEWSELSRLRESTMRAGFAQKPAVSDPKLRALQAKTHSNLIRADITAKKQQLRRAQAELRPLALANAAQYWRAVVASILRAHSDDLVRALPAIEGAHRAALSLLPRDTDGYTMYFGEMQNVAAYRCWLTVDGATAPDFNVAKRSLYLPGFDNAAGQFLMVGAGPESVVL